MRKHGLLASIVVFLASVPSVLAISPEELTEAMASFWTFLGAVFSGEAIPDDPALRVGIVSFLFFILIMVVVQRVVKKYAEWAGNRTAGIIGFVVAAGAVWFSPNALIGHAVMSVGIPLAATGLLAKIALVDWKEGKLMNFFGLVLMIGTLFLVFMVDKIFGAYDFGDMNEFIEGVFTVWFLILIALTIWKVFQFVGSLGGEWGKGGKEGKDREGTGGGDGDDEREDYTVAGVPPRVKGVTVELIPGRDDAIRITWEPLEDVDEYIFEWSYGSFGPASLYQTVTSKKGRWYHLGGTRERFWHRKNRVPGDQNSAVIEGKKGFAKVLGKKGITARVRARNKRGKGPWGYSMTKTHSAKGLLEGAQKAIEQILPRLHKMEDRLQMYGLYNPRTPAGPAATGATLAFHTLPADEKASFIKDLREFREAEAVYNHVWPDLQQLDKMKNNLVTDERVTFERLLEEYKKAFHIIEAAGVAIANINMVP